VAASLVFREGRCCSLLLPEPLLSRLMDLLGLTPAATAAAAAAFTGCACLDLEGLRLDSRLEVSSSASPSESRLDLFDFADEVGVADDRLLSTLDFLLPLSRVDDVACCDLPYFLLEAD